MIAVDLMGNENSPETLLVALKDLEAPLLVIAPPHLQKISPFPFLPAFEAIELTDHPTIFKQKKSSSMLLGLQLLAEKKVEAFISAGNTGALLLASKTLLGMQEGIERPALLALIPTRKKPMAVLDVGAMVDAKAEHLVQFAKLFPAHSRIGLLNIGVEPFKGTKEHRLAYQLLQEMPNFVGNVEGTTAFNGDVDVLVTDGFSGNIFLKTAEGMAHLAQYQFDESAALLAGVNGAVFKCHANISPTAFAKAVKQIIQNKSLNQVP